ncbi:carbonic anhydrase family protein [Pontibacter cellulosilyticus]|uniref:Carbonic anhydrase n=1 Tax=Pontibacter cellulosilyticus TaxID=1720253 RepID=A0A923SHB2_9BACT|nr:carbonic anhydrase family protein [Pontibacter cellulosilyticus]MBC5991508.1 carbonic anhydrase [Pontibacter cellulosilyticus]
MKKSLIYCIAVCSYCLALPSCKTTNETENAPTAQRATEVNQDQGLIERVLTAEEQAALTPDAVLQSFKEGNQRFRNNDLTRRNHSAQVRASAIGQYPKAVVLSCLDSRIPVEDVFDKGIGDVFVARVAGNFVNEDILGSMEFGCKVAGSKLIVVMGHESCGAVQAAIDDVKMGNITAMLENIRPVVLLTQDYQGERTSKNKGYVNHVSKANVANTVQNIKQRSPILREMADKNEIKIVGAFYDMETGIVTFVE